MLTKVLVIVGISVVSVVALFVMGNFLDKKPRDNEQGAANSDGKARLPGAGDYGKIRTVKQLGRDEK